jgi:hypothetical protein
LEVILEVEAGIGGGVVVGHPLPAPVGAEPPGIGLILEGGVEDGHQPLLDDRVVDRDHHLHATVEVPFHEVR